jgi:predicted MFS family arabinose efflux permease
MLNLKIIFTSKKYFAAAQLFLALSLLFGTWVIYIPAITTKIGLSKGNLGIVLLFGAIGALFSLPLGKLTVSKLGEGKLALVSVLMYSFSLVGNFISTSFFLLCVSLFLNGFTSGFLQLGINSIVSTLEKEDKVAIMSSCHGFFSLGGLISAGFGTMLLILIGNPLLHILLIISLVIVLQILFARSYIGLKKESRKEHDHDKFKTSAIKSPMLWGLAVVAICVMVTEGAIADWSGLFLRDVVLSSPNIVGLGYAGFSITMTLGRFLGDYFTRRFGAWQVILSGFILSMVGFAFVLTTTTLTTLTGFLLIGFGFSSIVPEIYRLSSNIRGVAPSSGITFMAGSGYFGFLAGPVVLGAIAEQFGLKMSFVVLLAMVAFGTIVSYLIHTRKSSFFTTK